MHGQGIADEGAAGDGKLGIHRIFRPRLDIFRRATAVAACLPTAQGGLMKQAIHQQRWHANVEHQRAQHPWGTGLAPIGFTKGSRERPMAWRLR
jgi:hypothetical protein